MSKFIMILVLLLAAPVHADDHTERDNLIARVKVDLFDATLEGFGTRFQMSGLMFACGNTAVSDALYPTQDQQLDFILAQLNKISGQDDEQGVLVAGLSNEEKAELVLITRDVLLGYSV